MFYYVFVTRVPHLVRRSRFLLRLCEAGPALQPKGGITFIYHLVAASIPEDRLRAEERHPREILGSYDTVSQDSR